MVVVVGAKDELMTLFWPVHEPATMFAADWSAPVPAISWTFTAAGALAPPLA